MSAHALSLCLAYAGATLGVLMVVPQILRTLANPRLDGVSPLSWSMTALACVMWLTYGVRTMTVPQIPGNVLLVSGAVAVVILVPSQTSRRRRALALPSVGFALVAVAVLVPVHLVGYIAVSIGLASSLPQVYDSLGSRRAGTPSAVSVSTWSIRALSQACWLSYAVRTADLPVAIAATVALLTALLLVGLEFSATLRRSGDHPYRETRVVQA